MLNKLDFDESQRKIAKYVNPSPLIYSDWLSKELHAEVYLKLECLQPGNSFKIRGATNALLSGTRPSKVITASGGNHGLGVAIACQRQKIPCLVVLPTSTSEYRVEILRELNADVQLVGEAWDEANAYALSLAEDKTSLYIHPFADKEVILGQGTIALELIEELDFDMLVASVGGGGLLTGIAMALEANGKEVEIVAVETNGADSLAQSLKANKLVELAAITSIAKTLGAKKTDQFIFDSLSRLVNHMFVVDDREAVRYLLEFLNHEKILVEPATSCIIAAAMQNREVFENRKIVFVICGSNVSLEEVEVWREQFKL